MITPTRQPRTSFLQLAKRSKSRPFSFHLAGCHGRKSKQPAGRQQIHLGHPRKMQPCTPHHSCRDEKRMRARMKRSTEIETAVLQTEKRAEKVRKSPERETECPRQQRIHLRSGTERCARSQYQWPRYTTAGLEFPQRKSAKGWIAICGNPPSARAGKRRTSRTDQAWRRDGPTIGTPSCACPLL